MENMEKATKVNKEYSLTLSKKEIKFFVSGELVSGKIFSICKNDGLRDLRIFANDCKSDFMLPINTFSKKGVYMN